MNDGQIIIMEEKQALQAINLFLRSSEIDQMGIDVFNSNDSLVTTFILSNYKRHTIHLQQYLPHFYCIFNNSNHRIEEQLEIKIPQEQSEAFQTFKKFSSFSISLTVELHKPLQTQFFDGEFLQEQNQMLRFANAHLKKLKETVIKRLEVEELKKPFTESNKNQKNAAIRKKRKLNFTTLAKLPQRQETQKKVVDRSFVETLKSLGRKKHQITDESEPSMEEPANNQSSQFLRQSKKYNTFFRCSPSATPESSRKELITAQQITPPDPSHFVKTLLSPSQIKPLKTRFSRDYRLSHNQQLLACTLDQIEKQKKAFEIIKSMNGKYSQENSPVKLMQLKMTKQKRSSPYLPLSSKKFTKRKVK